VQGSTISGVFVAVVEVGMVLVVVVVEDVVIVVLALSSFKFESNSAVSPECANITNYE